MGDIGSDTSSELQMMVTAYKALKVKNPNHPLLKLATLHADEYGFNWTPQLWKKFQKKGDTYKVQTFGRYNSALEDALKDEPTGMKLEDFVAGFGGLESHIKSLENQKLIAEENYKKIEDRLASRKKIMDILNGLKTTPQQTDPGAYAPAYYFVKEITKDNIIDSAHPCLAMKCPQCKKTELVLMKYEQTVDSPDGDVWQKQAFVIHPVRPDNSYSIHIIKTIARENGF